MLKRAFIVSIIFLGISISLFLTNLFIITKKDLSEFESMTQKNGDFKSQTAHQIRKDVKKDLYIIDNSSRNHYIVSSNESEIFLNKKNQKYELIENLNNIKFLCYENVEDQNSGQIKDISAQSGIYYFPAHKLNLKNIDLSFYNITNSIDSYVSRNPFFTGMAKELFFSVNKKKPVIEVKSFEGSFNPHKGL
ncbi:MAG: hypothetical protein WCT85_03755 [Parachlamydiales bacterium]|jgi:hypothetical protein